MKMKPFVVRSIPRLRGVVSLPGDKSIAHRSIIIAAITDALTRIENFPANVDCLLTLRALRKLGIKIKKLQRRGYRCAVIVKGKGFSGLVKPSSPLLVGDSGTTLRLLLGVLAGQAFKTKLIAGESLSRRPMLRVTAPLRLMAAKINSRRLRLEEYPPITISGGNLKPIIYKMPIASAQVKSAILLAGLYAVGSTRIVEPVATRDHTERMLKLFKADIQVKRNTIVIKGDKELVSPKKIYIPGDISSAAFFIVAATLLPDSQLLIRKVSLNPSRIGIIRVLERMGADIKVTRSGGHKVTGQEPMGDIVVKGSNLRGTVVKKKEIPSLIDELPILMVAASCASGRTVFVGVGELRVKETDRIRSMSWNLKRMGSQITALKRRGLEHIVIQGQRQLKAARVRSFGDHRTAMSLVVAALAAKGKTRIDDVSCINKSFPNFLELLRTLVP